MDNFVVAVDGTKVKAILLYPMYGGRIGNRETEDRNGCRDEGEDHNLGFDHSVHPSFAGKRHISLI